MSATRRATAADLDATVATLAESHRDYVWEVWAIPGSDRELLLDRIYRLDLERVAVPAGGVWIHDDGAAVAVWHAPDAPPVDAPAQAALDALALEILGDRRDVIAAVEAIVGAARPTEPHWYLGTMGTRPARRREGCGTAVLGPVLDHLDAAGETAHLETSAPANLAFYGRLGFTVTATFDALPHGAPTTWAMQRLPVSGRRTG